jgi:hypothetical protein
VLTADYYKSAVQLMAQYVPRSTHFVFSDDIDWVRANLDFPPGTVYANASPSPVEDLFLMSRCQHHIIANSTFSWWAAWLSASPHKIVVAPRCWYVVEGQEPPGLIPDTWVRL